MVFNNQKTEAISQLPHYKKLSRMEKLFLVSWSWPRLCGSFL